MRMLTVFLLLLTHSFLAVADIEAASQAYRNKEYRTAFEAFTKLANDGNAKAQTVLAMMYKYGESTPVDLEQAFHWYLEAGFQGHPLAQYNVGIMLAEGVGVTKDPEAAIEWLSRAVSSRHPGASDMLAMLTDKVEIAAVAEPVAWSRNWNFRLPNDIRFQPPKEVINRHERYRIQFGAMSTIIGAERLWRQARGSSGSLLNGFDSVYKEESSGSEIVWKVQSGSFSSKSSAEDFCSRYKANPLNKTGCLVVRK